MFAQLFAVLPFTVTLTYLASVAGMVYFSEFSVVPLLVLNTLVVNVTSIGGCGYNEINRYVHFHYAMQCPRCRCFESIPDQHVINCTDFRNWTILCSSCYQGHLKVKLPSSPLAVTAPMGRLVVQSDGGGDDPEPKTSSSVMDRPVISSVTIYCYPYVPCIGSRNGVFLRV